MSSPPPPLPATTASASTRDLVLIGGGHAHVHLLKSSGLEPLQSALRSHNIRITLISRDAQTPYSGMLPGYVAGHYSEKEMHIDLEALCAWSGVTFVRGEAVGIDYFFDDDDSDDEAEKEGRGGKRGRVHLAGEHPPILYDALGIDVGSSPGGFFASASSPSSPPSQASSSALPPTPPEQPSIITPVKPISSFSARYASLASRLRENVAQYTPEEPFVLLVVGGGAGGVEVALAAHHHLGQVLAEAASSAASTGASNSKKKNEKSKKGKGASGGALKVILATRGESVLMGHNPKVRKIFRRILEERGVEVRYNADAVGVNPPSKDGRGEDGGEDGEQEQADSKGMSTLTLSDASQPPLHFHECLWCTSARAPPFLSTSTPFDTTDPTADGGFLLVDDTYQCASHPGVFASGDCANMSSHPRPKAGVFAVRAGPVITENVVNYLLEKELKHHEPQKEFLGLISTGNKYAVMSRGRRWAMEGKYLWSLKDKIDRKWMEGYQKLPPTKK